MFDVLVVDNKRKLSDLRVFEILLADKHRSSYNGFLSAGWRIEMTSDIQDHSARVSPTKKNIATSLEMAWLRF
jgi:hypothetical protein